MVSADPDAVGARGGAHTQGLAQWVTTRDGRRLYSMVLDGPGDTTVPTVVFEAGAAATRSTWALVQPPVSRFARAVVYDRSGLGRSPADPVGRTIDRMADDLLDVLDHYGPGPFVLVGVSAGGPIVRAAAARRPGGIAGLVLVDATDEASDVLLSTSFRIGEKLVIPALWLLARLRVLKYLHRILLDAVPADVRADYEREAFEPGIFCTQWAQARTFLDELAGWRSAPPELGDIPVTSISGGRAGDGMSAAVRASANAAHAHRAATSPRGRHVIAEQSGHYVPVTEPDVIVAEIQRLARG